MNANIDGDEVVYHDVVDISVAVATPKVIVAGVSITSAGSVLSRSRASLLADSVWARARTAAIGPRHACFAWCGKHGLPGHRADDSRAVHQGAARPFRIARPGHRFHRILTVVSVCDRRRRDYGSARKARDGKLAIEDLAGGTFTISNGGVFGSLMGTPIINMPQSAILGMHAVKDRPVAVNGQVRLAAPQSHPRARGLRLGRACTRAVARACVSMVPRWSFGR